MRPEMVQSVPDDAFTMVLDGWQLILEGGMRAAQSEADIARLLTDLDAGDAHLPPSVRNWIQPRVRAVDAIAPLMRPDWVLSSMVADDLGTAMLPIPPLAQVRHDAMRELQALLRDLDDAAPTDELSLKAKAEDTLRRLESAYGPSSEIAALRHKAAERLFQRHALPALAAGRLDEFRRFAPLNPAFELSNAGWNDLAQLLAAKETADLHALLERLRRVAHLEDALAIPAQALPELGALLARMRHELQRRSIATLTRAAATLDASDDPEGLLADLDTLDSLLDGSETGSWRRGLKDLRCNLLKRCTLAAEARGDADELRRLQAALATADCAYGVQADITLALELLDAERLDDATLEARLWKQRHTLERRPAERIRRAVTRVALAFAGDTSADRAAECAELVEIALGGDQTGSQVDSGLEDLRHWFALRAAGESGNWVTICAALDDFLRARNRTPFRMPLASWAARIEDPWVRCVLHHAGRSFDPPLFVDALDPLDRLHTEARDTADRLGTLYRNDPTALERLDGDIAHLEGLYQQWVALKALFDGDPLLPRVAPPRRLCEVLEDLREMRALWRRLDDVMGADLRQLPAVRRLDAIAGDLRQRVPRFAALQSLHERAQRLTIARGLPLAWQKCKRALDQCAKRAARHGNYTAFAEAAAHVETVTGILAQAGLVDSACLEAILQDVRRLLAALVAPEASGPEPADLDACRAVLIDLDAEEEAVRRWLAKLEALRPPVPEGARLHADNPKHKRFLAALDHPEPRALRTRALATDVLRNREYVFLQDAEGVPSWIIVKSKR